MKRISKVPPAVCAIAANEPAPSLPRSGIAPVATELARRAGNALIWRGRAMRAEKIIFLACLLAREDFGLVAIGMVALAMASTLTDFGVVAALIQ